MSDLFEKILAKSVLQDWNCGKISFYTEPPKDKNNVHLSAQIVNQWSKEFNLDEVISIVRTTIDIRYNPKFHRKKAQ
jgi:hypothetical protein